MNSKIIRKKASVGALPHPKDRKVDQFQRVLRREVKIGAQHENRRNDEVIQCSRFYWFRSQCTTLASKQQVVHGNNALVQPLVALYIQRNEDEVAELKRLRNPPRGRINHLDAIRQQENDEFISTKGIRIPDILAEDGLTILTEVWDGEFGTLNVVPSCQITKTSALVTPAAVANLRTLLKTADEVRTEQQGLVASVPKKLTRFRSEKKKTRLRDLVKTKAVSAKAEQTTVVERIQESRKKRVLQTQRETKVRRQAAVAHSRRLNQM